MLLLKSLSLLATLVTGISLRLAEFNWLLHFSWLDLVELVCWHNCYHLNVDLALYISKHVDLLDLVEDRRNSNPEGQQYFCSAPIEDNPGVGTEVIEVMLICPDI